MDLLVIARFREAMLDPGERMQSGFERLEVLIVPERNAIFLWFLSVGDCFPKHTYLFQSLIEAE